MSNGERGLSPFASAPRYATFYELFERAGANLEEATGLLERLITDWPDDGTRLRFELKELETAGDRITHDVMHHLNALASVLHKAGQELATALGSLSRPHDLRPHIVALYDLEHEGDRLERAALSALFDRGIDPMVVIRWKDIYQRLEAAIDACRHAANTLEGLVVKNT
jgi:uncharacterized protein Yka (UPF0111/DUF47 family)